MTPVLPQRKAIIVGASSGLGAELAKQLCEAGWQVAGVARRRERLTALEDQYPGKFFAIEFDVRNLEKTEGTFSRSVEAVNGLDLIVYAAGIMPEVALTEFGTEKDLAMIEVNLSAAVAWLNLAADRFQQMRSGTIVGIGSVAGDRGRMGQPVYNTTKAALATYLEALRNRLAPFGVNVLTIKPGPMKTEMTAHLNIPNATPPELAASRIIALLHRNGEFYVEPLHRLIFGIIKLIPSPIFRGLKLQ